MSLYTYSPLNEEQKEIRLLSLLPPKPDSNIYINISIVPLVDGNIPTFEAVSYTWGSAEDATSITVQSPGHGTVPITQNLAKALKYLQHHDRPRLLWIDAISVNQGDVNERSSQVKRMKDIFSKADRVLVWLGEEVEDTQCAIECITTISSCITVDWSRMKMEKIPKSEESIGSGANLLFNEQQFSSLANFFDSDWFERLWIWQEVHLGSPTTIAIRGTQHVLWRDIRVAVFYLCWSRFPPDQLNIASQLSNKLNRGILFLCDQQQPARTFSYLLRQTNNSKYTDPRDRVFAVLSLCNEDMEELGIEPDYSKTVAEVYQNAAMRYMQHRERLVLEDNRRDDHFLGAPSWVPNWTTPRDYDLFDHTLAAMMTKASISLRSDNILEVMGVEVTSIKNAQPVPVLRGQSTETTVTILRNLISTFIPLQERHIGSESFQAFYRTVIAGKYAELWDPPIPSLPSMNDYEEIATYLLDKDAPEPTPNKWSSFVGYVLVFLTNRAIFTTNDGRIGIGPQYMQPDDILVVFLGSAPAHILRPEYGNEYTLIGEAYCEGIMSGEALLGPYSDEWERIFKFDESVGHHRYGFLNRRTGLYAPEDPRLGDLPEGWKRESHSQEKIWSTFSNQTSGETLSGGWDPRLAPEILRARGVKLTSFPLI